jgi:hypothetical protein
MANTGYVILVPRRAVGQSGGLGAAIQRLALTATGTAQVLSASGAAARAALTGTGVVKAIGFTATGAPALAQRTAVGYTGKAGSVVFEARVASGQARGAVFGAAVREKYRIVSETGFVHLERRTATGVAHSVVPATYLTAVLNARNNYVTEYGNYEFNGYARIGNEYYATGPDGLYLLDGTTDDGADISWSVLTGQMDGKDPGLKRLPEVLLALRNTGPVKVTVRPDDNLSYDYMLPAVKLDTLHQHRVVPGKGMRSRYFAVGLQAVNNSKVEIDSMQVNMTKTTRRLG